MERNQIARPIGSANSLAEYLEVLSTIEAVTAMRLFGAQAYERNDK
jgi:hypothetical protein